MLNHRLTGPLAAASAFCLTIGVASAQPAPDGGPGPEMPRGGPRHQQGPPGMPHGPMGPMGGMGMRGGPMRPMGGPPGMGDVQMQDATYLGVEVSPIDAAMKAQLKLSKTDSGLLVNFVADDGPAKQAGLKQYDVLTRLDDQILFNPPQLQSLVRIHAAGDEVKLTFIREGQTQTATAKLQTKQQMVSQGPFGGAMPGMPPMDGSAGFGGPGPGGAGMPTRTISLETQDLSLTVSSDNGKPVLVAKDKAGKELFNGSIETPEQRQAIPPEVRKEFDKVAENYLVTSMSRPNRGFGPGWGGPQHGFGPGGRWRGGSEADRQAGTQPAR